VRIARSVHRVDSATPPTESGTVEGSGDTSAERRQNVGGSQRVVRVTLVYLVALVALYTGFMLYDRTAPGGSSSPVSNGVFLFTGIFLVFALAGSLFTLHPAPRAVVVTSEHVTVVGRFGVRRVLPPLGSLSTRVVRRYPAGWLSDLPVEQVELWGAGAPLRTYLVEEGLFRGANLTDRGR
jgi:hypothetical protein